MSNKNEPNAKTCIPGYLEQQSAWVPRLLQRLPIFGVPYTQYVPLVEDRQGRGLWRLHWRTASIDGHGGVREASQ